MADNNMSSPRLTTLSSSMYKVLPLRHMTFMEFARVPRRSSARDDLNKTYKKSLPVPVESRVILHPELTAVA